MDTPRQCVAATAASTMKFFECRILYPDAYILIRADFQDHDSLLCDLVLRQFEHFRFWLETNDLMQIKPRSNALEGFKKMQDLR